ncbi:hypothetical protein [Roseinatronobacter sp. NSM]|uniref:hypothetical protein n=1 Tax=Roseinatronobacter sp. NSM TaxID=3457785 RepID=UPI004035C0B3
MNSQIIIRGTAIAIAGIAASIFAAKEFMVQSPQPHAQAQVSPQNTNGSVVGASLLGGASSDVSAQPAAAQPEDALAFDLDLANDMTGDMAQPTLPDAELVLGALDNRAPSDTASRLDVDFRPELALAETSTRDNDASCTPVLTLDASVDALLNLRVNAPCNPSERVVISHDDLAFSAYSDADGVLSAYIPALSENASVDAFLEDGTVLQGTVTVPDVALHHRVIVQWTGDIGLSLHAFHRGAEYGSNGHIHASRPFDPDLQEAFVIGLGEARGPEPMLAHIYSVPVNMLDQSRMELEAVHDMRSCGTDVSAYIMQTGGGMRAELKELLLSMPACGMDQGLAVIALPFEHAQQAQPLALDDAPVTLAARQD